MYYSYLKWSNSPFQHHDIQGLKDLDYNIQEKSVLEYVFDFEFDSNVTESTYNSKACRAQAKII